MERILINQKNSKEETLKQICKDLNNRLDSFPTGLCPVDVTLSFLKLCECNTCGKCVPCRVGLKQLDKTINNILDGKGKLSDLDTIEKTSKVILESADCILGKKAAEIVLTSVKSFKDDYLLHIENDDCIANHNSSIPCVENCPAHVDIPGYISLIENGKYEDAVKLIRKDNPLPISCAYVCEHPCEEICRRTNLDYPINIRGLKKFAVDNAKKVKIKQNTNRTNKKIAIIGGGPSGITCAYYLNQMGHDVTIFEKRNILGGMLQYGIPNYRLPKKLLQDEIENILEGITVKTNFNIDEKSYKDIEKKYDAVYIAIGAHGDKKLGCDGEDEEYVIPAVKMLSDIGEGIKYDFTNKKVLVVGGGNVAMDAARSSIRCKAEKVTIVYRRRKEDMTALAEEVEGAMAEGCEILELAAPKSISKGIKKGLYVKPQMISTFSKGRPAPKDAEEDEYLLEADVIIMAIGQDIISKPFEACGIETKRNTIVCDLRQKTNKEKVFVGGDCATGPSSAINAIAAGKNAAANIDNYLGYNHQICSDVEIPNASFKDNIATGRLTIKQREVNSRIKDFELIEKPISNMDAKQEASRCLRCDHYGCASFKGGFKNQW